MAGIAMVIPVCWRYGFHIISIQTLNTCSLLMASSREATQSLLEVCEVPSQPECPSVMKFGLISQSPEPV